MDLLPPKPKIDPKKFPTGARNPRKELCVVGGGRGSWCAGIVVVKTFAWITLALLLFIATTPGAHVHGARHIGQERLRFPPAVAVMTFLWKGGG